MTQETFTRLHRPEDYTEDLLRYVAGEVNVNPNLMIRFAPMANAMLRKWEDAALEYSTFTLKDDKPVSVSTHYKITDYSSNKLFGLFSKLLELMGVGKALKSEDIDIAFVLLGGVLNAYGSAAGLDAKAIGKLDKFRLKNSDFLTCSSFGQGKVIITNLETKTVDTLKLPEKDVQKIVDYAYGFMTKDNKEKYERIKTDKKPKQLQDYDKRCDAALADAKKAKDTK